MARWRRLWRQVWSTAGNGSGNNGGASQIRQSAQEGGKAALVLGLCFISEGAIRLLLVIRCVCCRAVSWVGRYWRNLNGDWCETDGTARWSVVLLIPGAITPVLGYLVAIIAVRWWRVWPMPS